MVECPKPDFIFPIGDLVDIYGKFKDSTLVARKIAIVN
jgi:hypothetical protein